MLYDVYEQYIQEFTWFFAANIFHHKIRIHVHVCYIQQFSDMMNTDNSEQNRKGCLNLSLNQISQSVLLMCTKIVHQLVANLQKSYLYKSVTV